MLVLQKKLTVKKKFLELQLLWSINIIVFVSILTDFGAKKRNRPRKGETLNFIEREKFFSDLSSTLFVSPTDKNKPGKCEVF